MENERIILDIDFSTQPVGQDEIDSARHEAINSRTRWRRNYYIELIWLAVVLLITLGSFFWGAYQHEPLSLCLSFSFFLMSIAIFYVEYLLFKEIGVQNSNLRLLQPVQFDVIHDDGKYDDYIARVHNQQLSSLVKECEEDRQKIHKLSEKLALGLAVISSVHDAMSPLNDDIVERAFFTRREVLSTSLSQAMMMPSQLDSLLRQSSDMIIRSDQLINVTIPGWKLAHSN